MQAKVKTGTWPPSSPRVSSRWTSDLKGSAANCCPLGRGLGSPLPWGRGSVPFLFLLHHDFQPYLFLRAVSLLWSLKWFLKKIQNPDEEQSPWLSLANVTTAHGCLVLKPVPPFPHYIVSSVSFQKHASYTQARNKEKLRCFQHAESCAQGDT